VEKGDEGLRRERNIRGIRDIGCKHCLVCLRFL
jgi:hypothetical protein